MTTRIATIVEGHGEQRALPVLLRRIVASIAPPQTVLIDDQPWRIPRSNILTDDQAVKKALDILALSVKGKGGIIVVLDSDDDCPARLGPHQAARIQGLRTDIPISVVIAHREYEAWILASAGSCAGLEGLPGTLHDHPDPEAPRDCKGWLSRQMPSRAPYKETLHQAPLSEAIDIARAQARSPSFDKLCREVARLIQR